MPISFESKYCLNGMFEMLRLTADIDSWIIDTNIDIDATIDNNTFEETINQIINETYPNAYKNMCNGEKGFYNLQGLVSSNTQFNEIIHKMIDLKEENQLSNEHLQTTIINNKHYNNWFSMINKLITNIKNDLINVPSNEIIKVSNNKLIHTSHCMLDYDNTLPSNTKLIKKGQKVLKKSSALLNKLAGNTNTNLFLSGKSFTITGKEFNFRFSKNHTSLLKHSITLNNGTIPYTLELLDKNSNYIAKGCIYFENTPVLDQVSSIILYIKSGNEREIIETANWSNIIDTYSSTLKQLKPFTDNSNNVFNDINICWNNILIEEQAKAKIITEEEKQDMFLILKDIIDSTNNIIDFMYKPTIRYNQLENLNRIPSIGTVLNNMLLLN